MVESHIPEEFKVYKDRSVKRTTLEESVPEEFKVYKDRKIKRTTLEESVPEEFKSTVLEEFFAYQFCSQDDDEENSQEDQEEQETQEGEEDQEDMDVISEYDVEEINADIAALSKEDESSQKELLEYIGSLCMTLCTEDDK